MTDSVIELAPSHATTAIRQNHYNLGVKRYCAPLCMDICKLAARWWKNARTPPARGRMAHLSPIWSPSYMIMTTFLAYMMRKSQI